VHRRLDDVLENCHVLPEIEALENHAELGADPLDLLAVGRHQSAVAVRLHADLFSVHADLAGRGQFQHVDATEKRGFTGTAAADDRDNVALPRAQRHALQHFQWPETLVEVGNRDCLGRIRHRRAAPLVRGTLVEAIKTVPLVFLSCSIFGLSRCFWMASLHLCRYYSSV
jgi:hypothetical protein